MLDLNIEARRFTFDVNSLLYGEGSSRGPFVYDSEAITAALITASMRLFKVLSNSCCTLLSIKMLVNSGHKLSGRQTDVTGITASTNVLVNNM